MCDLNYLTNEFTSYYNTKRSHMERASFDIDERVALSGKCDFPTTGKSHSLLLGIVQHARQLTVSLRDQQGDVLLARQVSTRPARILDFFDQLTVLSSPHRLSLRHELHIQN